MDNRAATQFIAGNARPLELAIYRYHFEGGTKQAVIAELERFQNPDGGYCMPERICAS